MLNIDVVCFAGGTYGVRVGTFATLQEAEAYKRRLEIAERDAALEDLERECEYCDGACRHGEAR